ncbi:hypothetical protein HDU78_005233 [Chytriomyces hyalinus]|nr:hypothetical protein HDU78_005233 [Chytriomyces hyalinus]
MEEKSSIQLSDNKEDKKETEERDKKLESEIGPAREDTASPVKVSAVEDTPLKDEKASAKVEEQIGTEKDEDDEEGTGFGQVYGTGIGCMALNRKLFG